MSESKAENETTAADECVPAPKPVDGRAKRGSKRFVPVVEKIGEDRSNLRRRGEWFRERTGEDGAGRNG